MMGRYLVCASYLGAQGKTGRDKLQRSWGSGSIFIDASPVAHPVSSSAGRVLIDCFPQFSRLRTVVTEEGK